MVKMLREKPLYETGLEFGLDKVYKDSTAVKNAVYRVYQQSKVDPLKFGLTQEVVDEVTKVIQSRLPAAVRRAQPTLREKVDEGQGTDIKDLILDGRRQAFTLVLKKLDRIGRSNKNLDEANLASLTNAFAVIFDKAQIIQGEATENVAILAKIDTNMNPEEALAAVLRMREANQVDKDRTNKKGK